MKEQKRKETMGTKETLTSTNQQENKFLLCRVNNRFCRPARPADDGFNALLGPEAILNVLQAKAKMKAIVCLHACCK